MKGESNGAIPKRNNSIIRERMSGGINQYKLKKILDKQLEELKDYQYLSEFVCPNCGEVGKCHIDNRNYKCKDCLAEGLLDDLEGDIEYDDDE